MQFRIADTFTGSLARLTGDEQKAVKTTAFDLQMNPASPGHHYHKLDKARDKNFWSVRVNADVRLIVHRTDGSLLLCYVDHHDKAYAWAERRKLETHPTTGAAQLVEIRETVKEIIVPVYVTSEPAQTPAPPPSARRLFENVSDADLLSYGVPREWINDVRAATEDALFALAAHLPAEATEALLELATGGTPRLYRAPPATVAPFDHPDAQRRFSVVANVDELTRALEYPWDRWTVFLHPAQREIAEQNYSGPARVAGSAGTGKTIVALHRAVHLAKQRGDARVLLTTFSDALATALQMRLRRLLSGEPRLGERIDVHSLDAIASRLYRQHVGEAKLADRPTLRRIIATAASNVEGHNFSSQFLVSEWDQVVDAWQVETWDTYQSVERLGRKTRLAETQRRVLWSIFERVQAELKTQGAMTAARLYTGLAEALASGRSTTFDHIVVDEAQDLSVAQLRFLAALGGGRRNSLFFAGDLGQRIFQQPFSWKSLGVDVRGRSRVLHVNYRTSHEIRAQADRLLGPALADVDGNEEDRRHTVSAFNGPVPLVRVCASESDEHAFVGDWLKARVDAGIAPHELGVIVRSEAELPRARSAVDSAALKSAVLDERTASAAAHVAICTMHVAKGLEFRAVAVMACDDTIVPLQQRIETVGDDADLKEVYDTERHLLYVACTRARDQLLVTGVTPGSEFLADLMGQGVTA